jgi:hypothetical protein
MTEHSLQANTSSVIEPPSKHKNRFHSQNTKTRYPEIHITNKSNPQSSQTQTLSYANSLITTSSYPNFKKQRKFEYLVPLAKLQSMVPGNEPAEVLPRILVSRSAFRGIGGWLALISFWSRSDPTWRRLAHNKHSETLSEI